MASHIKTITKGDGEKKINLTALQRIDASIVEIVDSAIQVALYKYGLESGEWEDSGIKGSFFLYKRSRIPFHGFVIMNQISTTNKIEPFVSGLDFLLKEPYLLYKNSSSCKIFCIWFYEVKEFLRVTSHIQQIVKAMKGKARLHRQRSDSESALLPPPIRQVPSILSLLYNAQMEYEKETAQNGDFTPTSTNLKPVENGVAPNSKVVSLLNSKTLQSTASTHKSLRRRLSSLDESCSSFNHDDSTAAAHLLLKSEDKSGICLPNGDLFNGESENGPKLKSEPQVLTPGMFQSLSLRESSNISDHDACFHEVTSEPHTSNKNAKTESDCFGGAIKNHSCQRDVDHHTALCGQALIHLLSSEPNIMAKIHRAYISSLNSHINALSSN